MSLSVPPYYFDPYQTLKTLEVTELTLWLAIDEPICTCTCLSTLIQAPLHPLALWRRCCLDFCTHQNLNLLNIKVQWDISSKAKWCNSYLIRHFSFLLRFGSGHCHWSLIRMFRSGLPLLTVWVFCTEQMLFPQERHNVIKTEKLHNTYLDSWPRWMEPAEGSLWGKKFKSVTKTL